MSDTEKLTGGNSNQVVRHGNTVIRQTGAWSPFVHQLLVFLKAQGFKESPILLETSATSEILSYIEGEVGNDPLKPDMLTEAVVIEAGKLLRKFHDITQNFVVPPNAEFMLTLDSDLEPEVICHNDFAPYNCVFKDGHIIGMIDFDTAAPGQRIWDIAYAVYRFVPLATDEHCINLGWQNPPDRAKRLKIFCDAYGLDNRSHLIETVIQRIQALMHYMRDTSSNLAHLPIYARDMAYIHANRQYFEDVLG